MLDLFEISSVDVSLLDVSTFSDSEVSSYRLKSKGKKNNNGRCDRLVNVRNAMLDECDRYVFGVDEYCALAVMIAYWIRSEGC